jgi:hypothetical protein
VDAIVVYPFLTTSLCLSVFLLTVNLFYSLVVFNELKSLRIKGTHFALNVVDDVVFPGREVLTITVPHGINNAQCQWVATAAIIGLSLDFIYIDVLRGLPQGEFTPRFWCIDAYRVIAPEVLLLLITSSHLR